MGGVGRLRSVAMVGAPKMKSYTVVIDEDVPVFKRQRMENSRYAHPLSWLLPKLKTGESLLYPATTREAHNGLRSLAYSIAKQIGRKFSTRQVEDNEGVTRLRIWRVA